jgi:hypothetical protein
MRFGTWNVRNLYRASSLVTVSKELSIYKISWERRSNWMEVAVNQKENEHFSMEKGMRIMN